MVPVIAAAVRAAAPTILRWVGLTAVTSVAAAKGAEYVSDTVAKSAEKSATNVERIFSAGLRGFILPIALFGLAYWLWVNKGRRR